MDRGEHAHRLSGEPRRPCDRPSRELQGAFHIVLRLRCVWKFGVRQEEQDRIRKRVKEDLKDAITAHAEYADNVLPRLKRAYLKKCQEAEVRTPVGLVAAWFGMLIAPPLAGVQSRGGRAALPHLAPGYPL